MSYTDDARPPDIPPMSSRDMTEVDPHLLAHPQEDVQDGAEAARVC
jgi:hypothetical protein